MADVTLVVVKRTIVCPGTGSLVGVVFLDSDWLSYLCRAKSSFPLVRLDLIYSGSAQTKFQFM